MTFIILSGMAPEAGDAIRVRVLPATFIDHEGDTIYEHEFMNMLSPPRSAYGRARQQRLAASGRRRSSPTTPKSRALNRDRLPD